MNKNVLTLLGCSGSLAFVVSLGSASHAMIPSDVTGGASKIGTETTTNSLSQEELPQPAQITNARIRDLAQKTFGCTCMNCQNAVRQMIQQGQLSL